MIAKIAKNLSYVCVKNLSYVFTSVTCGFWCGAGRMLRRYSTQLLYTCVVVKKRWVRAAGGTDAETVRGGFAGCSGDACGGTLGHMMMVKGWW